jgi:hypothetical protein
MLLIREKQVYGRTSGELFNFGLRNADFGLRISFTTKNDSNNKEPMPAIELSLQSFLFIAVIMFLTICYSLKQERLE